MMIENAGHAGDRPPNRARPTRGLRTALDGHGQINSRRRDQGLFWRARTHGSSRRREGVVEMGRDATEVEATQTGDLGVRIRSSSPWQQREKVDRLFDLVREDSDGAVIVDPPRLRRSKLIAGELGEDDLATCHSDRSSRRTSLASIMRPASTSAPEAIRARCSAERSSSLSQSPGSNGSNSTSVPSGRSVGSSTTKRPFWTRAFKVMLDRIPAKAAADNRRLLGWTDVPSNSSVNPTVRSVTGLACARPAPSRPAGYAER